MSEIAHNPLKYSNPVFVAPLSNGIFRRKCACGNHTFAGGECEECGKRKRRGPQAQFRVSSIALDSSAFPAGAPVRAEQVKDKALPNDKADAEAAAEIKEAIPAQADAEEDSVLEDEEEQPAPDSAISETEPAASAESAPSPDETEEQGPKAKVEFMVLQTALPFGGPGEVKTLCPAPRNAPVGFSVGRSTAAQRAAIGACTWGITSPDPLQVATRTCRDGANWRLRVRRVRSVVRTFSRQLAGQREPTVGNSTAANFCTQVSDLDALGNCPGNFYMLAAVRAHEQVHVDEWRTSMGSDWPAQQAIIDGLSVPAAGATRRRSAATAAMRSSAAFTNAIQTSNASGNYPAFWGIPDPNINTQAAERVVVAPRIRQLCVNARNRGWGPAACPVCVNNGIT
ncbi:hypothetical protein [Methylomicrobium sp. Wu6]|uniref:hypothetical protein n=1 Tax=Methylomicrobium sp. Wu6 TaxID=3107928 RepID=UPI002DD63ADC|nr:hypothetical protein [Methylomicrobium sp. Wu6]MEC4748958.1 hypothetical protein [Methylomicrobium sp. Wu6]